MFITKTRTRGHSTYKCFSSVAIVACLTLTTALLSWSAAAETDEIRERHATQSNSQNQQKRAPNWQRLANRLNLDDQQNENFVAVMSRHHQLRVELRQSSGLKEAVQGLDEDVEKELTHILSEEQLAQFISHREEKRQRRHNKHNGKHKEKHG